MNAPTTTKIETVMMIICPVVKAASVVGAAVGGMKLVGVGLRVVSMNVVGVGARVYPLSWKSVGVGANVMLLKLVGVGATAEGVK